MRAEAGPRTLDAIAADLIARPRAVLVAGRAERDPQLGAALAAFAERAAIPLLAEPLSGARRGAAAVAHYDALLRDDPWAAAHRPDLVLRVGDLPTSKPLRQWLHGLDDAIQIAFDPEHAWQDPAGFVSTIVGADPRSTLATVGERLAPRRDRAWLDGWLAADGAAARVIGGDAGPARAERAARGGRARGAAAAQRDARGRVLDARARRRDVLPGPRRRPARARQPRRQRDRRHGLDRVRRRRRRAARARSCC